MNHGFRAEGLKSQILLHPGGSLSGGSIDGSWLGAHRFRSLTGSCCAGQIPIYTKKILVGQGGTRTLSVLGISTPPTQKVPFPGLKELISNIQG